jgi:DNA-binding LacI/PurR family transcriptional regulator
MNRSEAILADLRSRLERGVYLFGEKFPSESQLSDEFSVSKVTMNKIISMLAVQGYLDRGVRGAGTRVANLSLKPRGNIVFLGPLSAFSTRVLHGLQMECLRHDYFPVVFCPEAAELQPCLRQLNRRNTAGIVSMGYGLLEAPGEIDLFCLDYSLPRSAAATSTKTHFLDSDNFTGGRMMLEEILRRGHREVAIFSSERFFLSSEAPVTPRVLGFHTAMREAGIVDCERRTFFAMPQSLDDAKTFLKRIRREEPPVTLICADSDIGAELIHKAGHELGIECPGEIALTGFGNVTCLPIATVEQKPELQGRMAARYLIRFHAGSNLKKPVDETVDTELTGLEHIPILTPGKK